MKHTSKTLKAFETRLIKDFLKGKINCPLHLSGGNEKELIEIYKNIRPQDWVFSTHRSHYHYLLKGGSRHELYDEISGKVTGICGGNGRSMHLFDSRRNFFTSGIVGGNCAIACGTAFGLKRAGSKAHVWCFVGDGATDQGHFYEAVRYATCQQLPITFVVEDNDLSIDTDKYTRWGGILEIYSPYILRYTYKRKYPHVGCGQHVTF